MIAVEGGDLDRDDVFNLGEAAPKRIRQRSPAGGGLQVKAKQRYDFRHRAAVSQQFVFARSLEGTQAEQAGMITQFAAQRGLGNGLLGWSADAGDSD